MLGVFTVGLVLQRKPCRLRGPRAEMPDQNQGHRPKPTRWARAMAMRQGQSRDLCFEMSFFKTDTQTNQQTRRQTDIQTNKQTDKRSAITLHTKPASLHKTFFKYSPRHPIPKSSRRRCRAGLSKSHTVVTQM